MQKTAALSSAQGDKVRRWNVSRHKAEIQTPPPWNMQPSSGEETGQNSAG